MDRGVGSTLGVVVAASLWILAPPACADDRTDASGLPAYVAIAERKLDLLERRMSSYASQGYRFLGASEEQPRVFRAAPLRLHFARLGASEERRSYTIEAGDYSARLEERLNRAAMQGYRVHEDGILKRVEPDPLAERRGEKIVFVLERDGRGPSHEYRLLDVGSPKQFRRRIAGKLEEGFRIRGLRVFFGGWVLLVLERPVIEQRAPGPATGADGYYRLIDEVRRDRLFERLESAVSEGYRIVAAEASPGGGEVVLLERATSPGRRYSYWSLDRTDPVDLERRLNRGGSEGYRFRRQIRPPFDLLMERAPEEERDASYRVIDARSDASVGESLTRSFAQGFDFVGMYEESLVLERIDAVTRP